MLVMNFGMCIAPILCIFTIKKFDSTLKVANLQAFHEHSDLCSVWGLLHFSTAIRGEYQAAGNRGIAGGGGSVRFLCVS